MSRLRSQGGFGLVEMVIALVLLNVGLLALVGSLNSGAVAVARASKISAATNLGDQQLSLYRALTWNALALDDSSVASLVGSDNEYSCDDALKIDTTAGCSASNRKTMSTSTECASPLPTQCIPSRTVIGQGGGSYRIDTYIVVEAPTGVPQARPVRIVTVVVRDGNDPTHVWARLSSTFEQTLG
ncbi:MAG: prepilin-type N-terminal cleavage/methylation domain-containing protein [Gaiellaceae bacterium]